MGAAIQKLTAVPAIAGDVWIFGGDKGLLHSTDGGRTFTTLRSVQSASALGFGKAKPGTNYQALYLIGTVKNATGAFRSTDKAHQRGALGGVGVITGAPDTYGRVYVGTNGRGLQYGTRRPDARRPLRGHKSKPRPGRTPRKASRSGRGSAPARPRRAQPTDGLPATLPRRPERARRLSPVPFTAEVAHRIGRAALWPLLYVRELLRPASSGNASPLVLHRTHMWRRFRNDNDNGIEQ